MTLIAPTAEAGTGGYTADGRQFALATSDELQYANAAGGAPLLDASDGTIAFVYTPTSLAADYRSFFWCGPLRIIVQADSSDLIYYFTLDDVQATLTTTRIPYAVGDHIPIVARFTEDFIYMNVKGVEQTPVANTRAGSLTVQTPIKVGFGNSIMAEGAIKGLTLSPRAKRQEWVDAVVADEGALLSDVDAMVTAHMVPGDSHFPLIANSGGYALGNAATPQIICDGDSLTRGYGSAPGQDYPSQLSRLLDTRLVRAFGVGGQFIDSMNADAAAQIDPLYSAARTENVVICWAGVNDIYQVDEDPATIYAAVVDYCQDRQAAGFKVVVATMLSFGASAPPDHEESRQTFNALVRANWATFSDGLADLAADPRIGLPGACHDRAYFYGDEVHLIDAGYAIVAGIFSAALVTAVPISVLSAAEAVQGSLSISSGDTAPILETIPCDLTGCVVTWAVARNPGSAPLVTKTAAVLDAAAGKIAVTLASGDTSALSGLYYREVQVTDASGAVKTLLYGRIMVRADSA
jgi:lysophospholipase L1-like esterase